MEIQTDLRNGPVKPWQEVGCCEACWMAEGERCTCRCGGEFHGMGNPNAKKPKIVGRPIRNKPKQTAPSAEELMKRYADEPHTLEWFEKVTPTICGDCGANLGPIEYYPHDGGWTVEGFSEKQWLYRHCDKCGYDWAIWKLGVPKDV